MKINNHDDTRFHRQSIQCNESHPYGDREVVAENREEIDSPDQRKGNGEHHHKRLLEIFCYEIEHDKDDQENDWHDKSDPLFGSDLILPLSAPPERVTGRQGELALQDRFCLPYKAPHVSSADIQKNNGAKLSVLA